MSTRPNPKSASEIIDAFGGTGALASRLGIESSTVSMWRRRGSIPGRWHLTILRLAERSGCDVSAADFLAMAEASLSTTSRKTGEAA